MTDWPGPLVERLRQLAHEGRSAGYIAKVLKVTRNAVIGQCSRRDITLRGKALHTRKAAGPDVPASVYEPPSAPRRFSWQ